MAGIAYMICLYLGGATAIVLLVLAEIKRRANERGMHNLEGQIDAEVKKLGLDLPILQSNPFSMSQRLHLCEKYMQIINDTKSRRGISS